MPYCKSCGAYIPDGLSACLACGFDEDAQRAAAAAAQKAEQEAERQRKLKQEEEDFARQEMERQRREQQERNRQWAEQERERRERQAENRQWAQEEYARRQAQREVTAEQAAQQQTRAQPAQDAPEGAGARQQTGAEQSRTVLSALSYISFFFVLISFVVSCSLDIVLFHQFTSLVNGNLTFDIPASCLLQILRSFQPVHSLQADSHTPCFSTLTLRRLSLTDIFVKIYVQFLVITHISSSLFL